jgi:hypothetical protein
VLLTQPRFQSSQKGRALFLAYAQTLFGAQAASALVRGRALGFIDFAQLDFMRVFPHTQRRRILPAMSGRASHERDISITPTAGMALRISGRSFPRSSLLGYTARK